MSGDIFFKSAARVTGFTGSFSNILTLVVPFDTKKTFHLPVTFNLFAFVPQTTIIGIETLIYKDSHVLRKFRVQRFELFLETQDLKAVFAFAKFYNSPVVIF